MAKKFSELVAKMSPESRARAAEKTKAMLAEMPLHELRQARGLTQKTLANALDVEQPAIAKLERRTDMYVSTLRDFIRAMGGELLVTAKFPDGDVRIGNFAEIEDRLEQVTREVEAQSEALRGLPQVIATLTPTGEVTYERRKPARKEAASPGPAGRRLAQGT